MSVPNMLAEVERIKNKFPQAWADAHTGNANTEGFIKLLAAHLHAIHAPFGLNGKRGNPRDLSDDAINWKGEGADFDPTDNHAPRTVIDVIGSAGTPQAVAQWVIVTDPNKPVGAAWVQPATAPPTPEPPHECPELEIPGYEDMGGDTFFRTQVGVPLAADYSLAGQAMNDGSVVWSSRTIHSLMDAFVANGDHEEAPEIIHKHRNEWRAILGLPAL